MKHYIITYFWFGDFYTHHCSSKKELMLTIELIRKRVISNLKHIYRTDVPINYLRACQMYTTPQKYFIQQGNFVKTDGNWIAKGKVYKLNTIELKPLVEFKDKKFILE